MLGGANDVAAVYRLGQASRRVCHFSSMLTPVDIHYLVGLLSTIGMPDDVELELGAMVTDGAAGKERDVDVTIKRRGSKGVEVFLGLEVKAEKRPLDLVAVEQLCQKLNDMGELTLRAIVSASGYSDPARSKAGAHGIQLLRLDPWMPDQKSLGTSIPSDLPVYRRVLALRARHVDFHIDWDASKPATVEGAWPVTEADGSAIPGVQTLHALAGRISDQVLGAHLRDSTVNSLGDGESLAVRREVAYEQCPNVWNGGARGVIRGALVSGRLAWTADRVQPEFKILVRDGDSSPFVGCVVAEVGDGSLIAVGIQPQLAPLTLVRVAVSDRLKNRIYRERRDSRGVLRS